ncbi:putative proteasome inhibitor [Acorus calamus]|uniref:Proteasome inhibitor n=1 Tax=Acorus calamus TaxID=4465 RepID=A0AAV9E6P8_ACOCL|nr:putative proteasome inhibitor [Acorus calamus]
MANENSVMAVIRASRPAFRSSHDKVVFAVHSFFLANGYSLIATGRAVDETPSSSSSLGDEEVGVDGWNESEDRYGFVYKKADGGSKKTVVVKCLALGDKLAVDALRVGDGNDEPVNLQINVNDYLVEQGSSTNYRELYKDLGRLIEKLHSEILNKVEWQPERPPANHGDDIQRHQSTIEVPIQPLPPASGLLYPPVFPSPYNDLIPGPGAGVYPTRPGFDGDMLVGPNDPRWNFGGVGRHPGSLQGIPPGVPPGARFDPYGPPGVGGFEPNRFVRPPRRPGSDTHPDLHFFHDGSDFSGGPGFI